MVGSVVMCVKKSNSAPLPIAQKKNKRLLPLLLLTTRKKDGRSGKVHSYHHNSYINITKSVRGRCGGGGVERNEKT